MSEFLQMLQSPTWWFSSVVVAILANIASHLIITYSPLLRASGATTKSLVLFVLCSIGAVYAYVGLANQAGYRGPLDMFLVIAMIATIGILPPLLYFFRNSNFEVLVYLLAIGMMVIVNHQLLSEFNMTFAESLRHHFAEDVGTAVIIWLLVIVIRTTRGTSNRTPATT